MRVSPTGRRFSHGSGGSPASGAGSLPASAPPTTIAPGCKVLLCQRGLCRVALVVPGVPSILCCHRAAMSPLPHSLGDRGQPGRGAGTWSCGPGTAAPLCAIGQVWFRYEGPSPLSLRRSLHPALFLGPMKGDCPWCVIKYLPGVGLCFKTILGSRSNHRPWREHKVALLPPLPPISGSGSSDWRSSRPARSGPGATWEGNSRWAP